MTESAQAVGAHRYRNSEKLVQASDPVWQAAADHGLIGIRVGGQSNNRPVVTGTGHEFVNLCSCSCLGLNHERLPIAH